MPKDMLSVCMSHGLSEKVIVAKSTVSILARSDTTATVIRATLQYTVTDPSTLFKLQAEMDTYLASTAGAGNTTTSAADIIQDSEAKELPYLHGDLVDLDAHRTGKPEKVFIPGGTNIAWTSREQDNWIFGQDTDLSRSERWLIGDVEKLAYVDKVADLNFGCGRYRCLGYRIAWTELNKCLLEVSLCLSVGGIFLAPNAPWQLFRNFDGQFVNPARP
ncbi:uncharacterized protein L3040_005303 [Drepanopeziza brunnea f. sp. 'multigermtubi']|uniref:uncharacterized protein n=1 Tax=Drepanopeziza brunnea f. sp. 'multigermtubi' TaxID=698441 RepID=UPI00238C395F|nr:hypothetical protein L3040_005303 [Drepanopeziza brunnea f. sp. 'multigermtubi']